MLARLVISLNWTLGSLALIFAFAGPQILDTFLYPVSKAGAVKAAKQIAEGQNAYFALHNRNLEFTRYTARQVLPNLNVQLDLELTNYDYDGFYADDGSYAIRAVTRPRNLQPSSSLLPSYLSVGVYHQVLPPPDGGKFEKKSGWVKLSGKKSGILSQFID